MKKSKIQLIIIIFLILAIMGLIGFMYYKKTYYKFNLEGNNEVVLYNGNDYIESGYKLYDYNKNDISNQITVDNNVNISVPGEYYVNYLKIKLLVNVLLLLKIFNLN